MFAREQAQCCWQRAGVRCIIGTLQQLQRAWGLAQSHGVEANMKQQGREIRAMDKFVRSGLSSAEPEPEDLCARCDCANHELRRGLTALATLKGCPSKLLSLRGGASRLPFLPRRCGAQPSSADWRHRVSEGRRQTSPINANFGSSSVLLAAFLMYQVRGQSGYNHNLFFKHSETLWTPDEAPHHVGLCHAVQTIFPMSLPV